MQGLYQVVQLWVVAEEGFVLLLLLVDKVLDVHVKAGGGDALRALRGLFTFLKQQRQEREKRVPAGTSRAHTCALRDLLPSGLKATRVPSHIAVTSSPRVPLPEKGPSPHGQPRRQHFTPWHREFSLLIPRASEASVPPHQGPNFSLCAEKLHRYLMRDAGYNPSQK